MTSTRNSIRIHSFLAILIILLLSITVLVVAVPENALADLATPPAAPANFLASVISGTQIDLTWSDLSSNEVGFLLLRSTNTGFTSGLKSVLIGPDVGNYSDTTVSINTTYYYRLLAYNAVWVSDWTPSPTGFMVSTFIPLVSILPAISYINQGDTLTCSAVFTDAGSSESWKATIDYGDGSLVQPAVTVISTFSISHLYTSPGTFTMTVSVTNNFGVTGIGSAQVIVHSAPTAVDGLSLWGAISVVFLLGVAFVWQLRSKSTA
jgi:hypothetical protein